MKKSFEEDIDKGWEYVLNKARDIHEYFEKIKLCEIFYR